MLSECVHMLKKCGADENIIGLVGNFALYKYKGY